MLAPVGGSPNDNGWTWCLNGMGERNRDKAEAEMAAAIVKKIGVGLLTAGLTLAIGEVRPCGARERQNTAHANTEEPGGSVLEREIRHQLQVLPFYSVF